VIKIDANIQDKIAFLNKIEKKMSGLGVRLKKNGKQKA
jgi:hypothetical protein